MSGIRGDFRKLGSLVRNLRSLGDANARAELGRGLATEALSLVQQGFDRSIDPMDNPWAPLKYRVGEPLRDTGRLMNSFTAYATGSGIRVGSNVEYAEYHQFGATIAPHVRTVGRYQAVGRNGKFRPHSGNRGKSVRVRFLPGGNYANGIRIPARPMLPSGPPGVRWQNGLRAVATNWVRAQLAKGGAS